MTSPKDKFAELVRLSIVKTGAADRTSRQALYGRLRAWNEQNIARRDDAELVGDDLRAQLEQAIAEHEAELDRLDPTWREDVSDEVDAPVQPRLPDDDMVPAEANGEAPAAAVARPHADKPADAKAIGVAREQSLAWPVAAALIAGLIAGAGSTYLWTSGKAASGVSAAQARPLIETTKLFLQKVRDRVVLQQKADPGQLADKTGARFMRATELWPELRDEEAKLPTRPAVIVRANADGYKVLAPSTLCTAAKMIEPGLVDPVRDKTPFVCMHFGYWNDAGAKF